MLQATDDAPPFQLRLLVAFDAELFGTILRIFVDEVTRHHVRRALALGLTDEVHSGSIACPQRFGSTLNLNLPVHLIAIDGDFACSSESSPRAFHALPAPSAAGGFGRDMPPGGAPARAPRSRDG